MLESDPDVKRIVWLLERIGYAVTVEENSVQATHRKTGEVYIVSGDDPLNMTAELAEKVGYEEFVPNIDLMDG